MEKNVILVVGLVDKVLDELGIEGEEFLNTRQLLLGTISVKFVNQLMQSPNINEDFKTKAQQVGAETGLDEVMQLLADTINQANPDQEAVLLNVTKAVVIEFAQKISQDTAKVEQLIAKI